MTSTPESDQQALVQNLTTARNELLSLLRDLPQELRARPGADGPWSPKDLVGHLASWENRTITQVQHLFNGQGRHIRWLPGQETAQLLEEWNRKEAQRKQDWSWQEVMRDLALMREELLWNLGWATADQLFQDHELEAGTVSPAGLLEGLIEHDREHAAQFRAWLKHEAVDSSP